LRRWLLACVGILLVADGYWASQNLVLKGKDDEIYWFRFPPMGGRIYIETPSGEVVADQDDQPRLDWKGGKWVSDGVPISDIRNFITYWTGPEGGCQIHYHLEPHATIATAMATLDLSFSAGVGSAAILSPVVERVGKPEDRRTALFFEPPKYDKNTCPFETSWRKRLPEYGQGFGYPPNVKAEKKAN
jgi:hypothetical protein